MSNLPFNILHNNEITREDLKLIINTTYNLFGMNNPHHSEMRTAYLNMATYSPLFWAIQHFIRECNHNDWNLAYVFDATLNRAFMEALEQNDIRGYLANLNQPPATE